MNKTKVILLLLASFLCTLAVFRFVKRTIIGEQKTEVGELPDSVFYTNHIAPLIFDHCIQCHRPSGNAPFPLMDYVDVRRKKKTIVKVVNQGVMPPWPADPEYTHFVGENILTPFEKQLINKWADQGFKEGHPADMPKTPEINEVSMIGKPDLTLYLDSILVEGDNRDKFLVVKVPIEIEKDTFIRAIEFVTGEHNLVHHLNGHLLNFDPTKKEDVHDGLRVIDVEVHPEEYVANFNALRLYHDDGSKPERIHSAVNYLPGVIGTYYPEGIGGMKLSRKATLVANDMHYAPVTKDLWDRSHFNIFFAEKAPERPTKELMLGTNGVSPIVPPLDIPPDTVMKVSSSFRLSRDISVLTINPHMHLLGTDFKAYGLTPEGDTIRLINIPRWDFRWQYFYTFEKMVHLPKHTLIVAEGTFDNTNNNPNNPFNPPQRIAERLERDGSGMRTTDEMFQFIITYLPYQNGDEEISLSE